MTDDELRAPYGLRNWLVWLAQVAAVGTPLAVALWLERREARPGNGRPFQTPRRGE